MLNPARRRIALNRRQSAFLLFAIITCLLPAATARAQVSPHLPRPIPGPTPSLPSLTCGRPIGQQIVFVSNPGSASIYVGGAGATFGIYIMNIDGTGLRHLTSVPAIYRTPRLSRDGTKILFASNLLGGTAQIFVMNSDGSDITNLSGTPTANDQYPAWSPDGRRIVFSRSVSGDSGIYVMNADGRGQMRIRNGGAAPAWSPDGRKIAFWRSGEIYVMNADGTGEMRLTDSSRGPDMQPVWSPDGRRIAFTRVGTSGPIFSGAFVGDIYIMNADGSAQTSITRTGGRGTNLDAVWSPDGRKILFTSERDGDGYTRLYTMNPDGSCVTALARPPALFSVSEGDVK